MKIGLLIPCTSNKRDWKNIKETYLYNLTLKSFLLTYDKEHDYVFYIGIDKDDIIFNNEQNQNEIKDTCNLFKNISFEFIIFENIKKGHLTKMWNILFKKAYNDNCDYFYQCGDDILFKTKGWNNDCIKTLKNNNNIGLTGPINNNSKILTQSYVSKKHMKIFGFFFPEEIINWCCDDWINYIYKPKHFFPLLNHCCINKGGEERYIINNNKYFNKNEEIGQKNINILKQKIIKLAINHIKQINHYINKENNKNLLFIW